MTPVCGNIGPNVSTVVKFSRKNFPKSLQLETLEEVSVIRFDTTYSGEGLRPYLVPLRPRPVEELLIESLSALSIDNDL